jgi:hypothetical protein
MAVFPKCQGLGSSEAQTQSLRRVFLRLPLLNAVRRRNPGSRRATAVQFYRYESDWGASG